MKYPIKIEDLFSVRGLSVIVTGAASGVGLGYAKVLAENGAHVTLTDLNAEALHESVQSLRAAGAKVWGAVADVTSPSDLQSVADQVVQREGRIDVLFANAGVSGGPGFLRGDGSRNPDAAIENLSSDQLNKIMSINMTGTLNSIKAVVPIMKSQAAGRIIVTSTVSVHRTETLVSTLYVASKAGLLQLVRQAALELANYGILVNAIGPGPTITNIGGGRLHLPEARKPFERITPLKRLATPEDLYGAALYLASPASGYTTGIQITIDGGSSMGAAD